MTRYPCKCCGELRVSIPNMECICCRFDCHGEDCRKTELYQDQLNERQLDLDGNKKTIFHSKCL